MNTLLMKFTGQYQKRWIHDGSYTEHECLKFRHEFESQERCLGPGMGKEEVKLGMRQLNDRRQHCSSPVQLWNGRGCWVSGCAITNEFTQCPATVITSHMICFIILNSDSLSIAFGVAMVLHPHTIASSMNQKLSICIFCH